MKLFKNILFLGGILASLLSGCSPDNNTINKEEIENVTTSKWGEEYNETIIGSLKCDIPYIEVDNFDVVLSEDEYGDPLVMIFLYFDEDLITSKLEEYSSICANEGYLIEKTTNAGVGDDNMTTIIYDVYYADKVITSTLGIELQFLEGSYKGRECMGIFAYNYLIAPKNYWPSEIVTSFLGFDIPHLEDDGNYIYKVELYTDYLYIRITNPNSYDQERYANLLKENNYIVEEEYYDEEIGDYYGQMAYLANKEYFIQFGQTTDYGLEIMIFIP